MTKKQIYLGLGVTALLSLLLFRKKIFPTASPSNTPPNSVGTVAVATSPNLCPDGTKPVTVDCFQAPCPKICNDGTNIF